MRKKRVVLTFPPNLIEQPIAYNLIKKYDLMVNFLRANITPREQGRLVIEMSGKKKDVDAGMVYLSGLGIEVESLAHDIKWHETKCVHCTACISTCPSGALNVDRATMLVSFNKDKCIACELCVKVCPYRAVEIQF
jgi:Fe-S-cluster-containing dehydrogenase component